MAYSVFGIKSSAEYKFAVIPNLKWLIIVPNCKLQDGRRHRTKMYICSLHLFTAKVGNFNNDDTFVDFHIEI